MNEDLRQELMELRGPSEPSTHVILFKLLKEIDIDLIKFTTGERAGEFAVCYEREPVFLITDLEGNGLITWVAHDTQILDVVEEGGSVLGEEDTLAEAQRVMSWLDANKYIFPPLSDEMKLKLRGLGEAFVARLEPEVREKHRIVIGRHAS